MESLFYNMDNVELFKPVKLIVWDWDDTFFPSTMYGHDYEQHDYFLPYTDQLKRIIAKICLQLRHTRAILVIVSNGGMDWILRCLKYLNCQNLILSTFRIYSARDIYEKIFAHSNLWKYHCLKNLINRYNPNEVISFGDGEPEFWSCMELRKMYPKITFKQIIFAHQPHVSYLIKQLETVSQDLTWICNHENNIVVKPTYFGLIQSYGWYDENKIILELYNRHTPQLLTRHLTANTCNVQPIRRTKSVISRLNYFIDGI